MADELKPCAEPIGCPDCGLLSCVCFDDSDQCWNCGGEGYVANCWDEIACMYPDEGCELCMRRCECCNAKPTRSEDSSHDNR